MGKEERSTYTIKMDAKLGEVKIADEVVAIIKSSKTVQEAIERLMSRFGLTEIQARYVVDMQLRQLTGLMQEKLRAELAALYETINRLKELLANKDLRMNLIKEELLDNITYIKTGSFKEELKSTVKPYVGSTNQEFRRVK